MRISDWSSDVCSSDLLGFFGYSFLEENGDKVKGIAINGVEPSMESIASFKYPAARPLFVYIKGAHLKAVPGLKEFVAEYTRESTWGPQGYLVRREIGRAHV